MFSWIPLVLILFLVTTPRRAVIIAFIGAWLFLPMYGYKLPGLPDYTKVSATIYGAMLGVILFDAGRLMTFRPSLFDIPMLVWCLCPFVSAPLNGYELYDGMSLSVEQVIAWGLPYFIGRLYFSDLEGLRELAIGIFIGGLIYMPLCLYEIRMSPQLHAKVYGFFPHDFGQTKRWGGWRPSVFMQHGLMVGMWMAGATLMGIWLWFSGIIKRIWGVPVGLFVAGLFITTVMCKSTGAVVLLLGGVMLLFGSYLFKTKWLVLIAVLIPPLYLGARIQGWNAEEIISASALIHEKRAFSVRYRVEAEIDLVERAMERPFFGWAGWGRNMILSRKGEDLFAADSMWIIVLGRQGLVGLTCLGITMILPGYFLTKRIPVRLWADPVHGSAVAIVTLVIIYTYDNLFNAMINPVFILAMGGAMGLGIQRVIHPVSRGAIDQPVYGSMSDGLPLSSTPMKHS
ncbi:MAG: O-antigen ligase domain-containing protein [Planctomycetota bacterium]|nr:O-antigen ligase domain-containing protein [Planctomycetota bacterium]